MLKRDTGERIFSGNDIGKLNVHKQKNVCVPKMKADPQRRNLYSPCLFCTLCIAKKKKKMETNKVGDCGPPDPELLVNNCFPLL